MTPLKRISTLLGVLALTSLGGWYAWRAATAPAPPRIVFAPEAETEVIALIDEHRTAVQASPRSGPAWGKLGQVLRAHAYEEEANRCFEVAARLDSAEPRWPYLHALHLLTGRPREATPLLREAVRRCRGNDDLYVPAAMRLAEALIDVGAMDEAETLLREARRLDPAGARLHFNVGLLAAARADWDAALAHFAAAQRDPRCRHKALLQRAGILRRQGREQDAIQSEALAQRLSADPAWPDPFVDEYRALVVGKAGTLRRAHQLEQEGRLDEAVELLRDRAKVDADDVVVMTLGGALTRAGRLEEAATVLRRAVELAPEKAHAFYLLSYALCVQGEQLVEAGREPERAADCFREAATQADRALALNPRHAFAHLFRGIALKHLKRQDDALTSFRAAILARPELPEAHRYLGEILAERGQVKDAIPHLENAVRLAHPDDPRPREALAKWKK